MAESIKARIKVGTNGTADVRAVITHPMIVEVRDPKTNAVTAAAHFIEEVVCTHKGETVFSADWGMAVSANPYLEFSFSGAASGESLTISWRDNRGNKDAVEFKVG
ncbi:MAG TPA: thiosulfate oxidation carrier complex protein SoxZ [Azospirillum sp.]